jgi:hypothetical protein
VKTPIATLLERASVALPPQRPSRSSWRPFAPVVRQLMTNGHTVLSSVDWLIEQKEVKTTDRTKAYRSLLALLKRHETTK